MRGRRPPDSGADKYWRRTLVLSSPATCLSPLPPLASWVLYFVMDWAAEGRKSPVLWTVCEMAGLARSDGCNFLKDYDVAASRVPTVAAAAIRDCLVVAASLKPAIAAPANLSEKTVVELEQIQTVTLREGGS